MVLMSAAESTWTPAVTVRIRKECVPADGVGRLADARAPGRSRGANKTALSAAMNSRLSGYVTSASSGRAQRLGIVRRAVLDCSLTGVPASGSAGGDKNGEDTAGPQTPDENAYDA